MQQPSMKMSTFAVGRPSPCTSGGHQPPMPFGVTVYEKVQCLLCTGLLKPKSAIFTVPRKFEPPPFRDVVVNRIFFESRGTSVTYSKVSTIINSTLSSYRID